MDMKNESMVDFFLIHYMKNWKYNGGKKRLSEPALLSGSSEYTSKASWKWFSKIQSSHTFFNLNSTFINNKYILYSIGC